MEPICIADSVAVNSRGQKKWASTLSYISVHRL